MLCKSTVDIQPPDFSFHIFNMSSTSPRILLLLLHISADVCLEYVSSVSLYLNTEFILALALPVKELLSGIIPSSSDFHHPYQDVRCWFCCCQTENKKIIFIPGCIPSPLLLYIIPIGCYEFHHIVVLYLFFMLLAKLLKSMQDTHLSLTIKSVTSPLFL